MRKAQCRRQWLGYSEAARSGFAQAFVAARGRDVTDCRPRETVSATDRCVCPWRRMLNAGWQYQGHRRMHPSPPAPPADMPESPLPINGGRSSARLTLHTRQAANPLVFDA